MRQCTRIATGVCYRWRTEDAVASFQDRVIGAMRLQAATFEEVEHDSRATSQAAIVVLAVTVVRSLGWHSFGVMAIVGSIVGALIGWVVGAVVVWFIGVNLLPGKNTEGDFGQLLRTVGFAQAPAVFGILAIIPILGWLIGFAVAIWVLMATVVAVKHALDYDDYLKPIIVCLIAWVAMVFVMMIASLIGLGVSPW
jgi:hypothetical protein